MNAVNFEKVGKTEILLNTIPANPTSDEYIWIGDKHEFHLKVSEIKDGYFTVRILLELNAFTGSVNAAIAGQGDSAGNEPIIFRTGDTYKIPESEKTNHELAYHLLTLSIQNFNGALLESDRNFSLGREYMKPNYADCLPSIVSEYSRLV